MQSNLAVESRLYERVAGCFIDMLQDFIEIQMQVGLGEDWGPRLLQYAEEYQRQKDPRNDPGYAKMRELSGQLMDTPVGQSYKNNIDISSANALLLYNTVYLTAVPRYQYDKDKAKEILRKMNLSGLQWNDSMNDAELNDVIREAIRRDVWNLSYCYVNIYAGKGNTAKGAPQKGGSAQGSALKGAPQKGGSAQGSAPKGAPQKGGSAQGSTPKGAPQKGGPAQGSTPKGSSQKGSHTAESPIREYSTLVHGLIDKRNRYVHKDQVHLNKSSENGTYDTTRSLAVRIHLNELTLELQQFLNYLERPGIWEAPGSKEYLALYKTRIQRLIEEEWNLAQHDRERAHPLPQYSERELPEYASHMLGLLQTEDTRDIAVNSLLQDLQADKGVPCSNILFEFSKRCGWYQGAEGSELSGIGRDEQDDWRRYAEALAREGQEPLALVCFMGYSLTHGDAYGYNMAGFLAMRMRSRAIATACYQLSTELDPGVERDAVAEQDGTAGQDAVTRQDGSAGQGTVAEQDLSEGQDASAGQDPAEERESYAVRLYRKLRGMNDEQFGQAVAAAQAAYVQDAW